MTNANTVDFDLSTFGELNAEVRNILPSLVKSIPPYDAKTKASLAITIDIKRAPDSATLVALSYSLRPTYPKKAQSVLCRTDLTGNLSVDQDDVRTFNLPFPGEEILKEDE